MANQLIGFTGIPLFPFEFGICGVHRHQAYRTGGSNRSLSSPADPSVCLSALQSISQGNAFPNLTPIQSRAGARLKTDTTDREFLSWVLSSSAQTKFGEYVRAITLGRWYRPHTSLNAAACKVFDYLLDGLFPPNSASRVYFTSKERS
jgi:hypothetical protein